MIKLFRNIRKTLLVEGKTVNYFKYAIGEIILVMIGILLALQVNNWNELRKTKIEEKLVLRQFKENLLSEVALLKIEYEKTAISEHYLNSISSGSPYMIPLDSLFWNLSRNLDFKSVTVDTKYFGLKSSGKLDIISNNKLKEEFVEFYETVHTDLETNINYHKDFVITNIESYLVNKFPIDRFLIITDTQMVKEELKNTKMMSLVSYQLFYYDRFLNKINNIINIANDLVKKIDVEIEK